MLVDGSVDTTIPVSFTNPATGASQNPDADPTFVVMGSDGLIAGGNGTAELMEEGSITGFTLGSPNTVTSTNHGLADGAVVTFSGVGGVTGLSGNYQVTVVDANNFTIVASLGGSFTSGGSWNVPGIYGCQLDSVIRSALEAGRNYTLFAYGSFSGTIRTAPQRDFTVIS